jgi:hypothetical protein
MKINISRQYVYLMLLSFFLFVFVLAFSFGVLIPQGKEYRVKRVDLKQLTKDLRVYKNLHNDTSETLQDLRSKNRTVIRAFEATFNPERFEKKNKQYFSALHISQVDFSKVEDKFAIYEVNTTSEINSPASFYKFLDAVNKSDWMIEVNFPIDFKRDGEMIKSSFKMKVYCNNKDTNKTASASDAK